jgi:hypothetical protein
VNVFYNFAAAGHRWPAARRKLAALFRKALRIAYRTWLPLRERIRALRPPPRRKPVASQQTA